MSRAVPCPPAASASCCKAGGSGAKRSTPSFGTVHWSLGADVELGASPLIEQGGRLDEYVETLQVLSLAVQAWRAGDYLDAADHLRRAIEK